MPTKKTSKRHRSTNRCAKNSRSTRSQSVATSNHHEASDDSTTSENDDQVSVASGYAELPTVSSCSSSMLRTSRQTNQQTSQQKSTE